MPRLEDADHRELLQPRQHAGRRDRAFRRDQRDLVVDRDAEIGREIRAEHDAEVARHEIGQLAALHFLADVGNFRLERRLDAAQRDAAHGVLAREQRLRFDIRRRADHFLVLARFLGGQLPVGHRPGRRKDFDVREHRQHAVAHFFLEPVHHRQHHDQRRDAERDARHRHERDERNEAVTGRAFAGAGVAPANLPFVGKFQANPFLRSSAGWSVAAHDGSNGNFAPVVRPERRDRWCRGNAEWFRRSVPTALRRSQPTVVTAAARHRRCHSHRSSAKFAIQCRRTRANAPSRPQANAATPVQIHIRAPRPATQPLRPRRASAAAQVARLTASSARRVPCTDHHRRCRTSARASLSASTSSAASAQASHTDTTHTTDRRDGRHANARSARHRGHTEHHVSAAKQHARRAATPDRTASRPTRATATAPCRHAYSGCARETGKNRLPVRKSADEPRHEVGHAQCLEPEQQVLRIGRTGSPAPHNRSLPPISTVATKGASGVNKPTQPQISASR